MSPWNVRFRAKLLRSWLMHKVLFCGLKFQLLDHQGMCIAAMCCLLFACLSIPLTSYTITSITDQSAQSINEKASIAKK